MVTLSYLHTLNGIYLAPNSSLETNGMTVVVAGALNPVLGLAATPRRATPATNKTGFCALAIDTAKPSVSRIGGLFQITSIGL